MDSAPVSPQRVYSLSREASEWVQGPSDHGQGPRQLLWEPKPLVEQISGTWARAQPVSESDGESGGSRLQLSPSHEPDTRWATQPQFLHLKTRSMTCHSHVLRNQTTNLLSKCQLSFPLLPNHEWSCALDSGQKTLKEILWTLSLLSETRPGM